MSLTSEASFLARNRRATRSRRLELRQRRETLIQHSSQLGALSRLPFARTPGLGTLRLGGELARHHRADAWQRALNRDYHACGCETGAQGLLIGMLVGVVLAALLARPWHPLQHVALVLGLALAGVTTGKLVGLLRAEARLGRTIEEIRQAVRSREAKVIDEVSCG